MVDLDASALLVIDVQRAFEDAAYWGPRNNPDCEANVAALVAEWRGQGRPVVLVRHDSVEPGSPLRPGAPGNAFKAELDGVRPDLLVAKQTNSAFYGEPDLHAWLTQRGLHTLVLCGITTNHCVETTARMGANLGYDVRFVLDATHTFDRTGPDGVTLTADELARATATSLHGEFATVVATRGLVPAPIACSLPMADLTDRRQAWQRLADRALRSERATSRGMELTYAAEDGVERELRELAALEADCCGFATWTVRPAGDAVVMEVTAPPAAVPAVHELFAAA